MEKMLWFGVTFWSDSGSLGSQVHGPFSNIAEMEDAIAAIHAEAESIGDDVVPVVIRFELCTDDVPEVVEV